ncbi:MAG: acyl-CoA reductase [Bacteroidota bacterium]
MHNIKTSLVNLGHFLSETNNNAELERIIHKAYLKNKWFTPEFIRYNLQYWSRHLQIDKIDAWLDAYPPPENPGKTVGIVMAGNIPLVGMHDMISVLLSGHKALIKTSSKDKVLIEFVADFLADNNPALKDKIHITEGFFTDVDAVLATGSNNTARYFDYYFKNVPHIIRRNRNGVAVLHGNESDKQLQNLAKDVFLYFGLGCRNVAKIYLPEGMNEKRLLDNMDSFQYFMQHNKYMNNYMYQRAFMLIDREPHLDNGFLLLRENPAIASPVAVLHYERYKKPEDLLIHLKHQKEQIQCIAAENISIENAVKFGKTQHPELNTYADDVDSMKFLLHL